MQYKIKLSYYLFAVCTNTSSGASISSKSSSLGCGMPAGGCALDKLAIFLLFLLLLFPILVNVTNLNVYNILNENRLYLKYC